MEERPDQEGSQTATHFRPVTSKVNFPDLEERILKFWREHDVFNRSASEIKPGTDEPKPLYMMFEGPPTANGTPGIHHILARVFKDILPRFKTMQGYRTIRKGGWDTHGLPVELEVEKELGITTKQEIEEYGIERFNARCRESVMRYVREWEELTERIGYWVDMSDPYITFENSYIETGWWILKQLWDADLVYQDMKGTPHCPRCVTSLSSHEVALGYREDTPDPSVFVKFQLTGQYHGEKPRCYSTLFDDSTASTFFLAWTTTPWTLPGNTGLAVNADAEYVVVELNGERLIVAKALSQKLLPETAKPIATILGSHLIGLSYLPLYDPIQSGTPLRRFVNHKDADSHARPTLDTVETFSNQVVAEDFVSLEDGTGIVHMAPAFGDEDLNAGRSHGLCFLQPVDAQGILQGNYPGAGEFVKDADEKIMEDLQERNLLYRRETYLHTYPFCWRCDTPLLYYAKPSWYIRTTAKLDRLISANKEINWYPGHLREGRFGEWLRNNIDWAISRERYWGTPIPIWRCDACDHHQCFGSKEELRVAADKSSKVLLDSSELDLHRPYIDRVTLECPHCRGTMRRIPEVTDAWYDSGAMPYAQFHYPFENQSLLDDGRFPAEYICEAVDQTRGWFYSLHALAVLLTDSPAYRNVICLGHILDESGEKMSKSRGNVVAPWPVIKQHGADAIRWYLYSSAPPGNSRRFSEGLVGESVRRFLLTLWNTYSFFITYANLDNFRPNSVFLTARSPLDSWALSELQTLIKEVTNDLETYDPTTAARRIDEFVNLLSTWYVRRSRRRFWRSENDEDKNAAYQTLYTCLTTLAYMLGPFTPFLAEELYSNLIRSLESNAPDSVHLAVWPNANPEYIDERSSKATRLAIRLCSLGRAARGKANLRVRQPLAQMEVLVRSNDETDLMDDIRDQLLDELNVREVGGFTVFGKQKGEWWDYELRPNLEILGPKYGQQVPTIRHLIQELDPSRAAQQVRSGANIVVGEYELLPEEIIVIEAEKPGWTSSADGGYAVRIDTKITPELMKQGLARELVHRVQTMRRSAHLDISDRIVLFVEGHSLLSDTINDSTLSAYIKNETLAIDLVEGKDSEECYEESHTLDGSKVQISIRKA